MPQNTKPEDGWTVVKRGIAKQSLAPSEAENFLEWLFRDLPKTPGNDAQGNVGWDYTAYPRKSSGRGPPQSRNIGTVQNPLQQSALDRTSSKWSRSSGEVF
jgi:hypothetical protein